MRRGVSMGIYIIAEAGVNHNGSLARALEMVEAAAEAGADAVKFQTFVSTNVISRHAPKAEYQTRNTGDGESQLEMVRKLELGREAHRRIMRRCGELGVDFLSTPFDLESLTLLLELGVERLKIPSGEITNGPLLLAAAASGLPLILSTGMCSLDEVEEALGVLAFGYLRSAGALPGALTGEPSLDAFRQAFGLAAGRRILEERVVLLHCTTEYPAPLGEVNLRAMAAMGEALGLRVGYSDHTQGITVSVAAAALGATVLEKHFTLDRRLPGPDHVASLEPSELAALVSGVREVELALGGARKCCGPAESRNLAIARKSLVAATPIAAGERFTERNLSAKRPGDGLSPMRYWEMLGQVASRDLDEDEALS